MSLKEKVGINCLTLSSRDFARVINLRNNSHAEETELTVNSLANFAITSFKHDSNPANVSAKEKNSINNNHT